MHAANSFGASDSTQVVELTAPGRAAVAVVVVDGPQATAAVNACFRAANGRDVAELPIGRIVFGHWGGERGEELIVCRRSTTQIEVHCHGGMAAVNAVVEQLVHLGCRHVAWRDWMKSTAVDPLVAAAQIALTEAPTIRTAAILLDQYHGALSAALHAVAANVAAADWPLAAATLDAVLTYRDIGLHLTKPWRVVLAGAANVGKSSLLNALAGFRRAIVSHQPGTTRDVVTVTTAIDGWPVELSDTAGLRDTTDVLESAGMALTRTSLADADLAILVSDATQPADIARRLLEGSTTLRVIRVIHVANKIDRITPTNPTGSVREAASAANSQASSLQTGQPTIETSAVTGQGIAELITAIGQALAPAVPPSGSALPFTPWLATVLERVRRAVHARNAGLSMELLHSLLTYPPENHLPGE